MKPLKKNIVTTIEVDVLGYYGDDSLTLESYIQQCYELPKGFEITDCPNDSQHRFEVTNKTNWPIITKAEKSLELGWCEIWNLDEILHKMCCDGFIEPGIYLVNMSW